MPNQKSPAIKLPEMYFQPKGSSFWLKLECKRFLDLDQGALKDALAIRGVSIKTELDGGLKLGDKILADIRETKFVDYAGPLAGHKIGMFTSRGGKRILVTSEAKPVQPKKGKHEWMQRYLDQLLGPEQTLWYLLWHRFGLESLDKGDFAPGQFPVYCGPSGCGKSLLQKITTALYGGRHANPLRYMIGKTNFNADLSEAEHLPIEDPAGLSLDIRSRRTLGESIKQITVVEDWSVHGKGLKAEPLRFFKRGDMTLNNQPEKVSILPPMDDDIEDKISLIKCSPATMLDSDREKNWANIERELPALSWAARSASVPKEWRDRRYGVRRYHDPELFQMLNATTPEGRLLELIDHILFEKRQGEDWKQFQSRTSEPWRGSAAQLEGELESHPTFGFQAKMILAGSFTNACGTYLGRLKLKFPNRFETRTNKGHTIWLISKAP